jgi:hypothetical protein
MVLSLAVSVPAWPALAQLGAPSSASSPGPQRVPPIVSRHRYPPTVAVEPFPPDSRLRGPSVWAEIDFLHRRINRARNAGLITRREARRLHREADAIALHAWAYRAHGFSASERTELANRARIVSDAVTVQASSASRVR